MCTAIIVGLVATLNCPGPRPTPAQGAEILAKSLTPWTPIVKTVPSFPRREIVIVKPAAPTQNINVTVTVPQPQTPIGVELPRGRNRNRYAVPGQR